MELAISVKELGWIILFIAIIILIIYLIVAVKHTINVLKKANSVLDDVNEISNIAAHRTSQVDQAIDHTVDKIANALTSVANILKKDKSEEIQDK
ncbi:MAG: hypothetical protein MJ146_03160 [Clostridia bacterium]|nr:hypothetical protein [Clostridia bacterium]